MICQEYEKKLESEAKKDFSLEECTADDSIINNEDNLVTPAQLPEYTESQQIVHYTLVFQVFVFMQLFNQINARMLEEGEYNVFAGITRNFMFMFVVVFTFIMQMTIVEVGGRFTKTSPLSMKQNLICIGLGAGELIWGAIIKLFDTKYFQLWQLDEKIVKGESADESMKKSGSLSSSLKRQKTSTLRK